MRQRNVACCHVLVVRVWRGMASEYAKRGYARTQTSHFPAVSPMNPHTDLSLVPIPMHYCASYCITSDPIARPPSLSMWCVMCHLAPCGGVEASRPDATDMRQWGSWGRHWHGAAHVNMWMWMDRDVDEDA